jgi:virginiamycin B lyase
MNPGIRLTLVLGVLSSLATACASSNPGTGAAALPAVGAPYDLRLAPPRGHHVRIREFSDLPGGYPYYYPTAIAAAGGKVWVIDSVDQDYGLDSIVGIATSGKRTNVFESEYGTGPVDITAGPDGALWMADSYGGNIERMTVKGHFTYYPAGHNDPYSIVTGPDNALWFTAEAGTTGGTIGRITTAGVITTFTASGETWDIAAGSDGALWFTEPYANRIGRITTSGEITEYSKGITAPYWIAAGPDGALWFTENISGTNGGNAIGRITTKGHVTVYSKGIAPLEYPTDIAAGPDNAMWFTETVFGSSYTGGEVGRISMKGKITEYSKNIDPQGSPKAISAGPDGRMWFVEGNSDRTGRITL